MARRDLLNDDERRRLFGLPESEAEIIRHYTLTPADLEYAADRHGAHNRLGFAVQLCLLRHPGFGLRSGSRCPRRCWTTLPTKLACRRRHSGTIAAAPRQA